ncbi:histidine phosphatase family protein [Leifsonia sp. YIM 134122]|uniref:Histidine phosphatase family protein n=1 Tax=Leifsonia stereocauli TaxID=3134136 RepID=A0ABU9W1T2_9MICO
MTSAPTRFLLVRHGETDWNRAGRVQGHTDVPLNELGRSQALAAAELLSGAEPSRIITSPLGRAAETAAIIAAAIDGPAVETEGDFIEMQYGEAEGAVWQEIRHLYADGVVPGAEPRPAVLERSTAALRRIAAESTGTVIITSHGGVINGLTRNTTSPDVFPGSAGNGSITEFAVIDDDISFVSRTPIEVTVGADA